MRLLNFNSTNKTRNILLIVLAIYFLLGILTLNDYGYTWDDPQEFAYAQANLRYLSGVDDSVKSHMAGYLFSPSNAGNLVGVLTKILFTDWLEILPADAGFHFSGVIFASLTLLLIILFSIKYIGNKAAIIATSLFIAFPRIFGHMHNNVKDITVMFAYMLVIYCAYSLYKERNNKWLIGFFASLAFAFNTKVLTLFLGIILVAWIIYLYKSGKLEINFFKKNNLNKKENKVKKKKNKSQTQEKILITKNGIIKAILIFIIIMLVLNPVYWVNPGNLFKTFFMLNQVSSDASQSLGDYPVMIYGELYTQTDRPIYYVPLMFGIVIPVITLLLFFAGLYYLYKREETELSWLLLLWLIIPSIIFSLPGISIYNIIRHILFLIPAIIIIASIGGLELIERQKNKIIKYVIIGIIGIGVLIPLCNIAIYHPYQTTYFNEIMGGIDGAEGKFEIEYWGNSYKEGTSWLNQNVENGSIVVVPIISEIPARYLRKDITVKNNIGNDQEFYYMFMRDKVEYNNEMTMFEISKIPEFEIIVKNTAILYIYKVTQ